MTTDLNVTMSGSDAGLSRVLGQVERAALRTSGAMEQYQRSTEDAWSSIARLEQQMADEAEAALGRRHDAYTRVGQSAMIMGTLIAAGVGLAAKAAMDWETAWTGVTKTVDGTTAEMAALEGQLRQLAKTLPFTHTEIAAVAESAGQLGVARGDIAGFTKTVLDMSVSTNLTSEQAATDFARLATIMQMPISEMGRLGSTAVDLGNHFATTEAEIVSLGLRLAGTGAQVGLSADEVFGLAAAMSSVGIEAEAGGTAMSQTMSKIAKHIAQGTDGVEQFATVAGMSSAEFTTAWRDDAAGALDAFVTGLGQLEASGGSALVTLDDLGLKGARQQDVLLRLAGASDVLSSALDTATGAYAENTALLEESNRFYETSENRLRAAKNEAVDLAIDFGAVVLPALVAVGEQFANVTAFVDKMPGPMKTATMVAAILTAGIALTGGAALVAIPKIAAFKGAVAALEAGSLRTAGTRLIGLGSILAGPLGLGLAAVTIGVGLFAAKQGEAARRADELRHTLDEQTGALTENSWEWVRKDLVDSGAMQRAKDLGINLATVTDAAMGNTDAIAVLNGELERLEATSPSTLGVWHGDEVPKMAKLIDQVGGVNAVLTESAEKQGLLIEANGGSADSAGVLADAQKGLSGALAEGTEEATDLADAADGLKKAFDALSGGFLNERQASRQVRDSLRDVRVALKEYRDEHGTLEGAFKKGTKSGDEFAGMVDGLAKDYQDKIIATREAGASEERMNTVYENSKKALQRVAEQLGMTKAEAREYVDQVLSIPELIETQVKVDDKVAMSKLYELQRMKIEDKWVRVHVTRTDGGSGADFLSGGGKPKGPQDSRSAVLAGPTEGVLPRGTAATLGSLLTPDGSAAMSALARALSTGASAQKTLDGEEARSRLFSAASGRVEDAQGGVDDAVADKASRLDLLQQRKQIKDFERDLAAKGKGRLKGLAREIAQAELKVAQRELAAMEASGKAVAKARKELAAAQKELAGFGSQEQEDARLQAAEDAAREAERAIEEAQRKAEQVRDRVVSQGSAFSASSPARASRNLDRLIGEVSTYLGVYQQLSAAGASPWLLQQLSNEADSGNYKGAARFGRKLLADPAMFAKFEAQGVTLGGLGSSRASIESGGPAVAVPGVPIGAGAAAATATPQSYGGPTHTVVNNFSIQSNQVDQIAGEVIRRLTYQGVI